MSRPRDPASALAQISELAARGPGRYLCPKCRGGSDFEASLSIRFDESAGIHWKCFRSSCGYTGGPRGTRSVFGDLPKKEPRYFTRPVKPVSEDQAALIWDKFGLTPEFMEGYSYWDDRFILPVFGPTGYNRRGVIAYSLSGGKPKSLTYNEKPAEPFLHWTGRYVCNRAVDIVIVEDMFSAEKVARIEGTLAVALLGTDLSQANATEISLIAATRGGKTWLALDKDAYPKSLKYLMTYREQFPGGLFAWSLARDLKYETEERIKEALDGANDFGLNASKPEYV